MLTLSMTRPRYVYAQMAPDNVITPGLIPVVRFTADPEFGIGMRFDYGKVHYATDRGNTVVIAPMTHNITKNAYTLIAADPGTQALAFNIGISHDEYPLAAIKEALARGLTVVCYPPALNQSNCQHIHGLDKCRGILSSHGTDFRDYWCPDCAKFEYVLLRRANKMPDHIPADTHWDLCKEMEYNGLWIETDDAQKEIAPFLHGRVKRLFEFYRMDDTTARQIMNTTRDACADTGRAKHLSQHL